jgi:hypothetical protein
MRRSGAGVLRAEEFVGESAKLLTTPSGPVAVIAVLSERRNPGNAAFLPSGAELPTAAGPDAATSSRGSVGADADADADEDSDTDATESLATVWADAAPIVEAAGASSASWAMAADAEAVDAVTDGAAGTVAARDGAPAANGEPVPLAGAPAERRTGAGAISATVRRTADRNREMIGARVGAPARAVPGGGEDGARSAAAGPAEATAGVCADGTAGIDGIAGVVSVVGFVAVPAGADWRAPAPGTAGAVEPAPGPWPFPAGFPAGGAPRPAGSGVRLGVSRCRSWFISIGPAATVASDRRTLMTSACNPATIPPGV